MCSPYMSRPVRACFDGETPADESPILEPETVETPVPETPEPETPEPEPITLFSAEELEARLAARDAEWEARLSAKDTEVSEIKSRFDAVTIERSLTDAISRGDAFSVEQVAPLLRPYTSIDASGAPIVRVEGFVMTPSEAVAWMRSQPERYGNLFKSNVLSGFGLNSTADGMRPATVRNIKGLSAREYRQLRESNPEALGFGDNR